MIEIYNRVSSWNAERFERKYDPAVRHDLLREEYQEWAQAADAVNDAKELLDIIYVAMGGIWALDMAEDRSEQEHAADFIELVTKQTVMMPGCFIGGLLDQNAMTDCNQLLLMHSVIGLALCQLQLAGLDEQDIMTALHIVCDSNDTKAIDGQLKPAHGTPAEPQLREKIRCLTSILH